jgi:RNA polymerase sigma-70 factor, ECF subfamily
VDRHKRDEQFTDFVNARSRALLGTAYLLVSDRQRAEDLVQTALLKTYLAWPKLREARAVEAYVRRTMVTTTISWSRRRWRGEIPSGALPQEAGCDGTGLVDGRAEVWPHLRALPPRQRAALVLRYYEDLTEQQVAEHLGCSVGTVKSQTHRALATLRARLAEERSTDFGPPTSADLTRGGGR